MKIILDTNVLISAFVFKGFAARVYEFCMTQEEVFFSNFILAELGEKLKGKFKVATADIEELELLIRERATEVEPSGPFPSLCRDPDDNYVLQLSAHVAADFVITGDKDLLVLERFETARILSPRIFFEEIMQGES